MINMRCMRNIAIFALIMISALAPDVGFNFNKLKPMDAAQAAERKQIRVGMECAYAPNNWQEPGETDINVPIENLPGFYADGYDVQIARIIIEKLDADLAIIKLAWGGLIESLNAGQIDMIIAGMAATDERRQAINFSESYSPVEATEIGVMVLEGSKYENATSIQDFAGASMLGQQDTMLDTVIDQIENVNHLTAVDSVPNQITRLTQGTCDAIVVNIESVPGYLTAFPNLRLIRFEGDKGFDVVFLGSCVGLRKSDTELLEQVNAVITEISQDDRSAMLSAAIERQPK